MAEEKKSESKQLKEKLFASKKHGALRMSEDDQTACEALCKDYMAFLNQSKTEREACANAEALLKEHGFVPFTPGMALKAGDKVIISKYSGTQVKLDGVEYTITSVKDVLAVVE